MAIKHSESDARNNWDRVCNARMAPTKVSAWRAIWDEVDTSVYASLCWPRLWALGISLDFNWTCNLIPLDLPMGHLVRTECFIRSNACSMIRRVIWSTWLLFSTKSKPLTETYVVGVEEDKCRGKGHKSCSACGSDQAKSCKKSKTKRIRAGISAGILRCLLLEWSCLGPLLNTSISRKWGPEGVICNWIARNCLFDGMIKGSLVLTEIPEHWPTGSGRPSPRSLAYRSRTIYRLISWYLVPSMLGEE